MGRFIKIVKFAQLSDTHLVSTVDDDGGYRVKHRVEQILSDTVADLNRIEGLNFVFFTGDNIDEQNIATAEKFMNCLADLKCPYYMVVGNHDITSEGGALPKNRYIEFFRDHGFHDSRGYYSFDMFDENHFVILDSALTDTWGGYVDPEQLEWLKVDLHENRSKFCYIVMHHNLIKQQADDDPRYFITNAMN